MKILLLCSFGLMVISASAQTNNANEPVVRVKTFRADGNCKITLGTPGPVRLIHGEVLAVYANRFMFEIDEPYIRDLDGLQIIIQNYPRLESLANGEKHAFAARRVGTIQGKLDDGTLAVGDALELWNYDAPPVPTPEQLAAARAAQEKAKADAKAKAAAQKADGEARALQANQDAAAKGDSFGLMRMGERYRDGDGVEKDLSKAREYLQKAADAGSPTAKDELSNLKSQ